MLRLHIDTKRTKPTIIRRAQLILLNPPTRLLQIPRHLLRSLHHRIQRVRHPNKRNLLHALGVATDRLSDLLVHARFVLFGRELDEEIAGVDGEEGGQKVAVGHVVGMDGVAVAAGAGVDADVGAFGGGEAG